MKKIVNIYTLNGNFNYGNKLQNYAIVKKMNDYGFKVNTIWFDYSLKRRLINFLKSLFIFKLKYSRHRNFELFTKKYLNRKYKNCIADKYIVGSDQVWNYTLKTFNPIFLKPSDNPKNNISFSASFGVDHIEDKYIDVFKNGFKNFKYISVREKSGKDIIKKLTNRNDINLLLDPTLLLTKEDWNAISKKPKNYNEKKYIFAYFLGGISKKIQSEINKVAKDYDCEIIDIINPKDKYYSCGPSEFIWLLKNAFLILTDSFHACVFSIIYKKNFGVFDRNDKVESMSSRIDNLLNLFDLKDNYCQKQYKDSILKTDFHNTNKIMKEEQEKSESFLMESLEIKDME